MLPNENIRIPILECPSCGMEWGTDDCTCDGLGITVTRAESIYRFNNVPFPQEVPV